MKLIKKTIVLVGDLSKGYVSVVRVRDETGIKVVGEDFTTNYRAIVKINKEREIFSLLGKKTEIGTKIKVESTDEIGCVVCDGEKIVASGGKGISQQEIKFLMCPPTHPQIEIDKREQEIIKRRFGIDNEEPKTLEQIGIALGFSKERIRQIENLALQKLRRVENIECLKSYLDAG